MKETFLFYASWAQLLDMMTDGERLEYLAAIVAYGISGERKPVSGRVQLALELVFRDIDQCREKYEAICERNRTNGQKGGRPKTQQNPNNPNGFVKTQVNPTNPTKPYNDNDNDNKNDNIKETSKEKKKRAYGETGHVTLTDDEAKKLAEIVGADNFDKLVNILDAYKGATGKRYKSDYLAIKNWVIQRYNEQYGRTKENNGGARVTESAVAALQRIAAEERNGSGADTTAW